MLKVMQNAYHYCKYGKVVHTGANGTTIRKKMSYPLGFAHRDVQLNTTKTIINKNGQVEKQLNRNISVQNDELHTAFNTVTYKPENGQVDKKTKNIYYSLGSNTKTVVDYNVPECDYRFTVLPGGRTQYEIYYPEVTKIIKNGPVTRTMNVKTYIK